MSLSYLNSAEMQLGLPSNIVRIVPYCPEWPVLFDQERIRISDALALVSHSIEHIGSTAVPGLYAKPVLDIMIGLLDHDQMLYTEAELVNLGYDAKGEKGVAGRLFLTHGDPCVFHVHLTVLNSPFWHEHILFRDSLRQQDSLAHNYVEIKARLAQTYPDDRDSYTRGKADFIESVISEASRNLPTAHF